MKTAKIEVLLSPAEASVRLKVTRRTLYSWLRSGRIIGVKVGGVWRIPEHSIPQ